MYIFIRLGHMGVCDGLYKCEHCDTYEIKKEGQDNAIHLVLG